MNRGDLVRLRVDSLAFGGDAVARAGDGRVVFVSGGAVPGDELDAVVTEVRRGFARASVSRLITLSQARVTSRCPLSGTCGGCQWQEAALDAQRAAKQAIVERALGRLGAEVAPLVAAAPAWEYRTRARFTVGAGAVGYQARRSHEVVDVATCPLLHPALDRALAAARAALADQLPVGATISGLVGRDDRVQLALTGTGTRTGTGTIEALIGRAGIVGVLVDGRAIGASWIDTGEGDEPPFRAAADGFAQASAVGNRALRRLVAEAASAAGARVLELYAGDGNFTRDLAAVAASVLAVEGDARAAARLRDNVSAAAVRAEPAERAARRLADAGERFDLAVIDPPRAGARELAERLPRLAPRLVYVSCDPMTLARDAGALAAAGLRPRAAVPVDLMPHTYHVEVVATFAR